MEINTTKSVECTGNSDHNGALYGIVVFKSFLDFLTMEFFCFFTPFVFELLAMRSPSLPWSDLIIIPVCGNPCKERRGALMIWQRRFSHLFSTEFHLAKTMFWIPFRDALRYKILLSLVCKMISHFLLYVVGKGKWINIVMWPLVSYTSLCPEGGGGWVFPCARQTLCKAMSQALMFLL